MNILSEKLKDFDIEIREPPKGINYDISILLFKEIKKGKKIEDLVKDIINRIKDYIESYEIKNGYLNLKLNWKNILKEYKKLFDFEKKNIKVFIEHTSANPNKALHIGHLRNFILGDSLVRLFKTLNYDVFVLNYIDDTGSQVADIILGFYYLKFPNPEEFNLETTLNNIIKFLKEEKLYKEGLENEIKKILEDRYKAIINIYGYFPKKFDHYCDFIYVVVNKLYNLIPELEKYKRFILKKIEEGDNEIYEFSKKITENILLNQLETVWKFDVYYDLLNKESDIIKFKLWDITFEILKNNGLIEYEKEGEKKGCWVIDLSKWKEFENLEDKRKVLVRSDGTTVYLAKDIAYAFWKLGIIDKDFKYKEFIKQPNGKILYSTDENGIEIKNFKNSDISINVIGIEQRYLQKIIEKIVESFSNKKYIYYGYGLVMLSKDSAKIFGIETNKRIIRMSGRKGININVDLLLEKMEKLVYENVKDKDLAFKISRSSISFEILKYDRNSTIVFDLNRMINYEESNALYIMYTYARINSLINKSGINNFEILDIREINEYERKLLKKLFQFKDILLEVEKNLEINRIAKYTIDLCKEFNEFYQNVPIIPELDRYPHRIFLVYLTKLVLEKLMYILKIDLVERI